MRIANLWINTASIAIMCAGCSSTAITCSQHDTGFQEMRLASPSNRNIAIAENVQGMIVHIDPLTGEIISEPSEHTKVPLSAETERVAVHELIEVPSPVAGGGIMVELNGQFETPLSATVDPFGKITVKHESTMHSDADSKR